MPMESTSHELGGKRERDGSRSASIIIAVALNVAALYMLFRLMGTFDVPASPRVEPTVAYLISEPPPLHHQSDLTAIHPRLDKVVVPSLDTPLNLNIVIPVPLIRPPQRSEIAVSSSPGNKPAVSETPSQGLVTGEQPGPRLWKITSGEHVLWVLGKPPTPLPKKVVWRSKEVETVLASTQELILDGGMEHLRPWAAAMNLRSEALKSLNLTDDAIFRTVRRDAASGAHETDVVTDADFQEFLRNGATNRSVPPRAVTGRHGASAEGPQDNVCDRLNGGTLRTRGMAGHPARARLWRERAGRLKRGTSYSASQPSRRRR
jgi:hypothetical protein